METGLIIKLNNLLWNDPFVYALADATVTTLLSDEAHCEKLQDWNSLTKLERNIFGVLPHDYSTFPHLTASASRISVCLLISFRTSWLNFSHCEWFVRVTKYLWEEEIQYDYLIMWQFLRIETYRTQDCRNLNWHFEEWFSSIRSILEIYSLFLFFGVFDDYKKAENSLKKPWINRRNVEK